MIIVSTEEIHGKKIEESLGIVKGEIVQSKNIGRDFMADCRLYRNDSRGETNCY